MTALRIGSLFSGYGGLEIGIAQVLDAVPVWHSEIDAAPSRILAQRFPGVPNLGDVTAIDWASVAPVDVLCGGFPCQDVSTAGLRRGLRPGTRSGLWSHFAAAIDELRPPLVVIENVRGLLSAEAHSDVEPDPWDLGGPSRGDRPALRALGAVLGDLADLRYDAEWLGVRAADAGAPHSRFRVFVLAHPADADGRRRRTDVGGLRAGESDSGRSTAPDSGYDGCGRDAQRDGEPTRGERGALGDDAHRRALADTEHVRKHGIGRARNGRPEPADDDRAPLDASHDHGDRSPGARAASGRTWGIYGPAVARWEAVLGREAPPPTVPAPNGGERLSAAFVEWMMGLPAGHVTASGISRTEQLRALGNGVVPQQAALAVRTLLS